MTEIKDLSNAFTTTIKDTNLKDISVDISEVLVDNLLEDGILKDIPIIGTILKLGKFSLNIKDHLFIKKIIYFISELKEISPKKRNQIISKIDNSSEFRIKIGEKLLYIIDKCEDHIECEYIAKFFKAFLNEKLTYSEFLRCSSILQNIFIEDFEYFINHKSPEKKRYRGDNDWNEYRGEIDMNLINSGLLVIDIGEINIRDQDDWKSSERYVVEGGEESIHITEIGSKIREIFK
jgi:uncharacterized ubiquitin-like protein YukD